MKLTSRLLIAAGLLGGASAASAQLTNYWPLDENDGETAPNAVPGGEAAVLYPGATWVSDPLRGRVLSFDGVDGYADAGTSVVPALGLETSFTWAFWANSAQTANNNVMVGNRWPDDGWIKFTTAAFEYRNYESSINETIDYPDFPVNTWVHHAVVKNGQLLTYYRDGIAIANNWNNAEEFPADRPFYLGGDTTNENWEGKLDDVATWTSALSPGAIGGIYANKYTPANAPVTDTPPPLVTVFSDDFSGDLGQWEVTSRGLENNSEDAGYDDAQIVNGAVVLGGFTGTQYWYGRSIETIDSFESRLYTEVKVKRVSLEGEGTAYRSSVWILGDNTHYFHFSQNVGETGWSYNARDDGGSGTLNQTGGGANIEGLDSLDWDTGECDITLRLIPSGLKGRVNIEVRVNDVLYAVHGFSNFPSTFKVVLTGQARAGGDWVSATFDDVVVAQEDSSNQPPVFDSSTILLPTAKVGVPYTGSLASFASDPEGQPLTFSKVSGPAWLTIAPDGTLGGTPDASFSYARVVVRATDAAGADDNATLIFRVDNPDAPAPPLFGWWPLNETSGNLAADISGGNNPATVFNPETGGLADDGSVWVEDPEFGRVISFNGADGPDAGRAVVGNPPTSGTLPVMDLSKQFTWSFWAKSAQAANNDIIVGNRYDPDGAEYSPAQFTKFTGANFEWYYNGTGEHINYDDIEPDVWMHHVVVKDGDALFYYRDGELVNARTITQALSQPLPINFGGGPNGVEAWSGYLHDVRFFDGALNETGVAAVRASRGQFISVNPTFTASFYYLPAAAAGTPFSHDIAPLASDPQNEPLTFSKESGPDWLNVSANGTITGTPDAATPLVSAVVKVSDPNGNTSTATFSLRVENPAAPAPVAFGAWPLNDGSGSIARDASGNGRYADIFNADSGGLGDNGSVWLNDPERGVVLSFDGTPEFGAYATVVADLPPMDLYTSFTWAFWAKPDQEPNNSIILGNRYDATGAEFSPTQFIKFTSRYFEWYHGSQQGLEYPDLEPGVWMHHAVVRDGNFLFYYRDGVLTGAREISVFPTMDLPLHFGGGANGVENWRGALSDVRLFEGALTSAAVAELATAGGVPPPPPATDLRITNITRSADGSITLQWNAEAGASYTVYGSRTLSGFVPLTTNATSFYTLPAGHQTFNPATEPRLFFRVSKNP